MTALLTPAEVAALFRVDPKTVARWAHEEKLSWVRTLGGHRRYHAAEIYALLNGHSSRSSDPLQTLVDGSYDGDPLRALQDLADRYGLAVTVLDPAPSTTATGSCTRDQFAPAAAGHRAAPAQLTVVPEPSQDLRKPVARQAGLTPWPVQ